ncbi:MAG: amino acid permease [SAR324 cluster bacterium]|nr:amino acid permease [SAR324 cluster bacterium]
MAVMIGVGAMIGPGVFALPGELAHMVGPLGIFVYLAMGILAFLTALNYSVLGAAIPIAGGGYSFASRTMPKPIAFFTGWFLWIGNTVACGMYVIIFALTIRAYFWPDLNIILLTSLTTMIFTAVNYRGMSESIKIITIMNLVEIAVLIGIALFGIFKIELPNLQPLAPMGFGGFLPAMALIYISYVGFDLIADASEEIINPGKTIPRAILITLGVGIAIYVFVVGIMMATVHYTEIAESEVPFIFVAERISGVWGRWAAIVATIMASLSAFSVTLGASARVLYALGRDGHFPPFFATLHRRYQTPYIALFVCAVLIMLISATGIIKFVASVADFGYLMGVGIVNCTVILLHKKMPNLRRPFKAFFFPWIPLLGAFSCWFFVFALELESLVLGGIMTLTGAGIYLRQASNREELSGLIHQFFVRLKMWKTSRRRRRMRVLIIGGGRHGKSVANQLLMKDEHRSIFRSAEHQVTFVEKNERQCQDLEQHYNVPIYQGDGTDKGLLEQIGLENMDVVIAALNDDNQNVVASLQAKRLRAPMVLSLVNDPDYVTLLEDNNIVAISTPKASAIMVENYLDRPGIAELFESGRGEGSLAGVVVEKNAEVIGKTIKDIQLPRECVAGAVIRDNRFLVPRGDTLIQENDYVLFVGLTPAIKKAREMFMVTARRKAVQGGSIFHLVERLRKRKTDELDRELQGLIKKRSSSEEDPFDKLVEQAYVLDLPSEWTFAAIVQKISTEFSKRLSIRVEDLEAGFIEGSEIGMTPAAEGVALPHLRFSGIDHPELALVRSLSGNSFPENPSDNKNSSDQQIHAFFFLVSPDEDPAQHLRILARIAESVDNSHFIHEWLTARNEQELKETLLQKETFFSLRLHQNSNSSELIGRTINELQMPDEIMVALIRRNKQIVVPRGHILLQDEDRLTIVGDTAGIQQFREKYED